VPEVGSAYLGWQVFQSALKHRFALAFGSIEEGFFFTLKKLNIGIFQRARRLIIHFLSRSSQGKQAVAP